MQEKERERKGKEWKDYQGGGDAHPSVKGSIAYQTGHHTG